MAKKKQEQEREPEETIDEPNTSSDVDTGFDLDDDYKPEPLMRKGWYKANVSEVLYDEEASCVIWNAVLDGNGGYMSDGETPVDGSTHQFRNWLPKVSDKDETSKSGKNKWQNKVNMLKKFTDGMQINMKTIAVIQEQIANQEWVGLPVLVELKAETYQGNTSMRAQNMKARSED